MRRYIHYEDLKRSLIGKQIDLMDEFWNFREVQLKNGPIASFEPVMLEVETFLNISKQETENYCFNG